MEKKVPFLDFPFPTHADWVSRANDELKGFPLEKLSFKTEDGIEIEPFYDSIDFVPEKLIPLLGKEKNEWWITQNIHFTSEIEANKHALDALNLGAEGLVFTNLPQHIDFSKLLKGIELPYIRLGFETHSNLNLIADFTLYCESKNYDTSNLFIDFGFDGFGYVLSNSASKLVNLVEKYSSVFLKSTLISFDASVWYNSGSTITQEIGITLATVHRLVALSKPENLNTLFRSISVTLSTSTDFNINLSKFRAFRMAWKRVQVYHQTDIQPAFLHAITAIREFSAYDKHTNMLRETTSAMAAACGGANAITVLPFDLLAEPNQAFAMRMGLNIQHILKHESYLDQIPDPVEGAWTFESITQKIVEKSLLITEELFSKPFNNTDLEQLVSINREKLALKALNKQTSYLGVNLFPNASESISSLPLGTSHPSWAPSPIRAVFELEKIRFDLENTIGKDANVALVLFGDSAFRSARSNFIRNFLGTGGIVCEEFILSDNQAEASKQLIEIPQHIVILCASDADYSEFVTLQNTFIQSKKCWIAGKPDEAESFIQNGILGFIHMKSTLVDVLLEISTQIKTT